MSDNSCVLIYKQQMKYLESRTINSNCGTHCLVGLWYLYARENLPSQQHIKRNCSQQGYWSVLAQALWFIGVALHPFRFGFESCLCCLCVEFECPFMLYRLPHGTVCPHSLAVFRMAFHLGCSHAVSSPHFNKGVPMLCVPHPSHQDLVLDK